MKTTIVADGVRVSLRDRERSFTLAIDGLEIYPGQAVGLTGASGTGKTLLLEVLGLLKRPDPVGFYGFLDGEDFVDLAGLWRRRWKGGAIAHARGNHFGFVPQSGGLLPFYTVRENIALSQKISGREDAGFVDTLIARLGLQDLARLRPHQLSIGQRQRAIIARALAHRPVMVIADEPTAALDPANAAGAMDLLLEMVQRQGAALIVSSHDVDMLDSLPLQRFHLEPDRDVAAGDAGSVLVRQPVGS
ncbi:ABC transporter ATP-binding protein [Devosia sp. Root635]|uniref:ABC transporter ATP-binding protein n=1 Tax=Devosia sp. Root635 TaxID=1736575 RepID=UPI0006FC52A1|nr:ATP-binding cassette domain-containing protein [Devosia sp. Root635]KRA52999.1 hypothetical protein ASD80_14470 [Devosia sp. Root635]